MAQKNNANIGFEKQIWDAACVLWGHIPAAEYRKAIVGLIFLRYISSAFEKRYQQLVYTPSSIVKTIVAILKPFSNCRVYDPCCGSGGMFVQSAKFIQAHSGKRGEIAVYGQESNADTWKMAKMNMAIRGIDADFGAYHADTFFNDLHKTLKADFIMANPPFNLSNWGQDKLKEDVRWKYGTPLNHFKTEH